MWKTIGLWLTLSLTAAVAQDREAFRVELSAYVWIESAGGLIQSGIVPVDLRSDLAVEQNKPQFFGKLVFKPARRHRLIVEGSPYRLTGDSQLNRQITFGGRTYTVRDRVLSRADLDYVSGAYQLDVISRPEGHWGIQGGVAYVNATGTITSQTLNFSASEQQSFPFPFAGMEGRIFAGRWVSLEGELKGMSLGSYGHYVQTAVKAGLCLGRHLTIQGGYLVVDAEVHRKDQTRGFVPRFSGAVAGFQLR